MVKFRFIFWLAAVCVAPVSCGGKKSESTPGAEKPAPGAAPANAVSESAQADGQIAAEAGRVSESRAGRPEKEPTGYTSVSIRFDTPLENAELVRVELTRATDSLGTDLIDPKKAVVETVGEFRSSSSDRFEARVSLKLAAREAKEIAEITGKAVFHDPAAAPKPIDIEDFRKQPGEFIPSEALEKAGLSIAYLDEATFDEKGSKLLADKVFGEAGLPQGIDGKSAQSVAAPMKILFQMPGATVFIIDDPEKQLIKVEGLDTENASIATGMESVKGIWIVTAREREREISKIRILLRSNDAEISRGFAISNIPLP